MANAGRSFLEHSFELGGVDVDQGGSICDAPHAGEPVHESARNDGRR